MKPVGAVALVVFAALGCPSAGAGETQRSPDTRTSRTFHLPSGRVHRVFTMRQPSGVVLLTRLTTTYGIRASVAARIPGGAGVNVVNYGELGDPSPCRRRGSLEICTPSHQWCPMPKAVWRVHLLKVGGPAGVARFDFVVGKPPRR